MLIGSRRSALLLSSALVGLAMLGLGGAAQAADQTYQFDIPAESLGQALTDFSRASSQQIVFSEDATNGRATKGLHGRYTAARALTVLLAGTDLQVETNSAGVMMVRSKKVGAASNEGAGNPNAAVETVTVTGSHIHNVETLTPTTTITSNDMIDQGYTTLSEVLEQLPSNSKAGASTESNSVFGFGNGALNNYGYASGVNLLSLGSDDTLVLLNGRRLPSTAEGSSTDISGIPVSAIDHVEILEDGASAVYGSDAVAGVVNIITKKDFDGIETGAHIYNIADGKQPDLGGYALGGFDWGTGNIVANYDFEDQKPLLASARPFTSGSLSPNYLLPRQQTSSVYAAVNQELADQLQFSASGIFSDRPYSASNNLGFVQTVSGRNTQYAGSAELDYTPISDWKLSLFGEFGTEQDSYADSIPSFSLVVDIKYHYAENSFELDADGTVISLPGGDVKLAVGASERSESFSLNDNLSDHSNVSRQIYSAYGELFIPLVGENNAIPLVQQLSIDAALRYDHYSDFGSTTDPKVTVKWTPVAEVSFHGSYSTSFKAPTLFQLDGFPAVYGFVAPANPADPGLGNALEYYSQANPNLRPETATTFAAGATITPSKVPGFAFDASYFNIDYRNVVKFLESDFAFSDVLDGQLGNFVNTNPTAAQINSQLAVDAASGGNSCYASSCAPSTIKAIANLGFVNAAVVQLSGLNLDTHYQIDSTIGQFRIAGDATYFLAYQEMITPSATAAPGAGIVYSPPRLRGKINVGWFKDSWSANARLNYTGSERNPTDPSCQNSCPVGSWTTIDLSASYAFQDIPKAAFLDGTRLNISVANVFDSAPPYVFNAAGINYDPVNANPLGRTFSISITKRW
ncbi:MAG: TonB-dependent receptor [Rhizomicrobium sp.]